MKSSVFFGLLGLAIMASAQARPKRRALLIGINHYGSQIDGKLLDECLSLRRTSPASAPSRCDVPIWDDLRGPLTDVQTMHDLLTSPKFAFDEVNVIPEQEATRNGILAAMQKYLVEEPGRGDVVLFYFAGHGSQRYNSLETLKPDKRDETIVPFDANKGAFDVRDREIADIFNAAIDKGIRLTALFDSCHSGTVARGIPTGMPAAARYLPYDPRDAHDPPRIVAGHPAASPEQRESGAIVISAAQHDELAREWIDDNGDHNGAFTVALTRALRALPADTPAEDVFNRVALVMDAMGLQQKPVLDASAQRKREPIFGGFAGTKLRLGIPKRGVHAEANTVDLNGGSLIGVAEGSELRRVATEETNGAKEVRLLVTKVTSLTRSEAKVLEPATAADISPGDLFEVDKWVAPENAILNVWLPEAAVPQLSVNEAVTAIQSARGNGHVQWISDPALQPPQASIEWTNAGWVFLARNAQPVVIGRTLDPAKVSEAVKVIGPEARVFISLPLAAEMKRDLQAELAEIKTVRVVSDRSKAQYALLGRVMDGKSEYSWVRTNLAKDEDSNSRIGSVCSADSPFPARTDWHRDGDLHFAAQISKNVQALARQMAWLSMPAAPPNSDKAAFPYRLYLRPVDSQKLIDAGTVMAGNYDLVLRRVGPPPSGATSRWVYVELIDCRGKGAPIYPDSGEGNFIPSAPGWPEEIVLTPPSDPLVVDKPFGTDTYILLTTEDRLNDTSFMDFEGAATRGARATGLGALFDQANLSRGAERNKIPTNWSMQFLQVRSQDATQSSAGSQK